MQNSLFYIEGLCPICKTKLEYEAGQQAVFCPRCSVGISTDTLLAPTGNKRDCDSPSPPLCGEEALELFDRFYRSYSWNKFATSSELTVPALDKYASLCLENLPCDPLSYVFEFRRIAVPLIKTVDGLELLEAGIAEAERAFDFDRRDELFQKYLSITKRIVTDKDGIINNLRHLIGKAHHYGAKDEVTADLESGISSVTERISTVRIPSSPYDIEAARAAKDARNAAVSERAKALGIDADEIYDSAMLDADEGRIDLALHKLLSIRGYKESAEIISKSCGSLSSRDGIFTLGKRTFLLKTSAFSAESLTLYEIKDGSAVTVLDRISSVIAYFGTKLFVIRGGHSLCCFLSDEADPAKQVIVIDSSEQADFKIHSSDENVFLSDKSGFIIEKKLRSERKRCRLIRLVVWIISLFRGKKKAKINRKNNFSTLLVDMDTISSRVIIPEAVDVMDMLDDKIFYLAAHDDDSVPGLRFKDVNTDADAEILSINHGVHGILGERLIFSEETPGDDGINMYSSAVSALVKTPDEGEKKECESPRLLADNVYELIGIYDGILLVSIGSEEEKRLCSVSADGGEIKELSAGYERFVGIYDGFAYYTVGEGSNTCLYRSALHGTQVDFLTSGFRSLIKITEDKILFRDTSDFLCSVCKNGLGAVRIIGGIISDNIVESHSKIYFIKIERTADGRIASSLYRAGKDGKELKKLIHGAFEISDFDKENFLVTAKRYVDYLVKTPISKKDYSTERITKELILYSLVNIDSGECRELFTLGKPEARYACYKTRFLLFFKRRRWKQTIVFPLTKTSSLAEKRMLGEGAVMAEEQREFDRIRRERLEEKQAKKAYKAANKLKKKQAKEEKRRAEEEKLFSL